MLLQSVCGRRPTYSRPVPAHQPQVVAEEGQDTDAEHGRHEEQEQNVEFGVCVRQLVLGRRRDRERRERREERGERRERERERDRSAHQS